VVAKVADFGMSREINEDTKTPEAVDDLRFGVLRARAPWSGRNKHLVVVASAWRCRQLCQRLHT
jgi:hypothetical protein